MKSRVERIRLYLGTNRAYIFRNVRDSFSKILSSMFTYIIIFIVLCSYVLYNEYPGVVSRMVVYDGSLPVIYRDEFPEENGQNIFLIESSFSSHLNHRVLCSLESYCKSNPKGVVWMVVTAPDLDPQTSEAVKSLRETYRNLHVVAMDVYLALRDTPVHQLLYTFGFWRASILINNLSDLTRLALIYKSGGLYSDSDVLALHPVTEKSNFVALQSEAIAANGVLHFRAKHDFLRQVMKHISENFQPNLWASSGPVAVTHILKTFCPTFDPQSKEDLFIPDYFSGKCQTEDTLEFVQPSVVVECKGMSVLAANSFYPVHWKNWRQLFSNTPEELCLSEMMQRSYGIHLSNKKSSEESAKAGSAVNHIASKACPLIYSKAGGLVY